MGWTIGNKYLNTEEMQGNALEMYTYFSGKGWSLNAIAGMLGNMQRESTLNPGIWQGLNSGNSSGGFGLVQWTPSTKYTNWAANNGYEASDPVGQMRWIDEVTGTSGEWIQVSGYTLSWESFKKSEKTPEYLASAFLKNFERAGVSAETERQTNACTLSALFQLRRYT